MCRLHSLFAQTALYNPSPKPWTGPEDLSDDLSLVDLGTSIEFIYGITPFIAKAISKNFELSQHLAYHRDSYPEGLLDACEMLHEELLTWAVDNENFSSIENRAGPELEVVKAQATAFYYSTLIYHYRSIQGCTRHELVKEQQAILAAMNLAEDLKGQLRKQDHWAAPITWPAFIASCEATGEYRQQWDLWWDRVQSYGLANYTKQRTIVHEVWTADPEYSPDFDWRATLSGMGIRVIPL